MNDAAVKREGWRTLILVLSFVESFGTILLERGIYFFTHERLHYSDTQNLALAAGFGAAYGAGAWVSHGLSRRTGDRAALAWTLAVLFVLHAAIGFDPAGVALALGFCGVGFFEGAKWPVVESYVAAGLGPERQLGAVGRFNVSWAIAVPLAVGITGPIITVGASGTLFALAAAANVISLLLLFGLPRQAPHLAETHPSRPLASVLERYRALLGSSRWSMLSSYALMFLLAPLLPDVFQRLGCDVREATLAASCFDAVRVLTFAVLAIVPVWHGRLSPLLLGALGLPLGFGAILLGGSLWVVLAGEVAFGVLAGITYYAALYYALVVKNAAVDAGGAHEGLIGLGLVLGPLFGLLGQLALHAGGSYLLGTLLGAVPLVLACWFGSLRSLARVRAA